MGRILGNHLTRWRRQYIYASLNSTVIDPGNGLSPVRHRAINWNNTVSLLIGPLPQTKLINGNIAIVLQELIWKCRLQNGGHLNSALMYLLFMLIWSIL